MNNRRATFNSKSNLTDQICEWLLEEKKRYYNKKRISQQLRKEMEVRAKAIIEQSSKNGSLRILEKNGTLLSLLGIIPALQPRVKNQNSLKSCHFKNVFLWDQKPMGTFPTPHHN